MYKCRNHRSYFSFLLMLCRFNPAKSITHSLTRLAILYIKIHMPALRDISILIPLEALENIITMQLTKTRTFKQICCLNKTELKNNANVCMQT